jgi:hypothetical protein
MGATCRCNCPSDIRSSSISRPPGRSVSTSRQTCCARWGDRVSLGPRVVALPLATRRLGSCRLGVILRPNQTPCRCASIGLVLLRELTFWSTRNVGSTISDAASPVDEIEKLKARHVAEIERLVGVAQETVEKLVQEALEDADRRIEELTEQRNDAVGLLAYLQKLQELDTAVAANSVSAALMGGRKLVPALRPTSSLFLHCPDEGLDCRKRAANDNRQSGRSRMARYKGRAIGLHNQVLCNQVWQAPLHEK